jgi:hypothetical protein
MRRRLRYVKNFSGEGEKLISGEEVLSIWSMCVTETEKFFPCGTIVFSLNELIDDIFKQLLSAAYLPGFAVFVSVVGEGFEREFPVFKILTLAAVE